MKNSDKEELSRLARLAELVARFERLDESIMDELKRDHFGIIQETLDAKKDVKRMLSESNPLKVDRGLGSKLRKIRDNCGYSIDLVVKILPRFTGKSISQESEEDIDYVDALFSKNTADYVDEHFFRRQNRVATLIVGESLPDHFLHHFQNLRECFSLGLFETSIIYCRAVIEKGCFATLRRREQIKTNEKIPDIREFSLKALMHSIRPLVGKPILVEADKVIKKADDVLHSKRETIAVTEESAYDAIKATFAILEELFSGDHRKWRS
jgi:hypothetical protein